MTELTFQKIEHLLLNCGTTLGCKKYLEEHLYHVPGITANMSAEHVAASMEPVYRNLLYLIAKEYLEERIERNGKGPACENE